MKRLKLLVVVVSLLIDLLPARAMVPEVDLQYPQRQECNTCPCDNSTPTAENPQTLSKGPAGKPPDHATKSSSWDWVVAWIVWGKSFITSNRVMAVFTMVLAWIGWKQRSTYEATLAATKSIERAYVKMSHKKLTVVWVKQLTKQGSVRTDRDAIEIEVKNWGNTPAFVTHRLLTCELLPKEVPLSVVPNYGKGQVASVGAFLVKDDSFLFTELLDIKPSDIDSCVGSAATHVLYIFGYVDYIDKFGACHRAGYARQIGPEGQDLAFVTQPGYNYDREYKEEN